MGAGKRVNYFVAQKLLECGLLFEHGGGVILSGTGFSLCGLSFAHAKSKPHRLKPVPPEFAAKRMCY
jgi:hypothetical protein